VDGLPVRGFYKITELARALGMSRWRLALLLQKAGIDRYAPGRVGLVPLHELETKARPLWEGVMSAEKLRQVARATIITAPDQPFGPPRTASTPGRPTAGTGTTRPRTVAHHG
jgi:hypothetical protein